MKNTILHLINATMSEYVHYSKSLNRPSLRRLMVTIIDQERRHKEEVEELDETLFNRIEVIHLENVIQLLSRPLNIDDEIDGLREVAEREDTMADLFESLAVRMEDPEGKIFFSHYSRDERKHAGLVRSRLELESLT